MAASGSSLSAKPHRASEQDDSNPDAGQKASHLCTLELSLLILIRLPLSGDELRSTCTPQIHPFDFTPRKSTTSTAHSSSSSPRFLAATNASLNSSFSDLGRFLPCVPPLPSCSHQPTRRSRSFLRRFLTGLSPLRSDAPADLRALCLGGSETSGQCTTCTIPLAACKWTKRRQVT